MKPSTRFLIWGIAWIATAAVLASAGAIWQVRRDTQARTLVQLQSAAAVEADLQAARFTELQLRASVLANDPAFVDYVAHALVPNPALGGAVDSVSIGDLLGQRRKGYDVAMVLDSQGHPVATSGVLLKDHASITRDGLVTRCIATGRPTRGMWTSHGRLLWVTVHPLLRGGSIRGLLLAATRVDNAFAIAVARITGTDIAILTGGAESAPAAQSEGLDTWETKALVANASDILAIKDRHGAAHALSGGAGLAVATWITSLPDSQGRAVMVAMDANAGTGSLVKSTVLPWLAGIAILGLAAVILVIVHWRRTCVPVDRICDVIEHAAGGDHFMHARVDGSSLIRQLREAVNRLLENDRVK